ncbi:hypothetical protein FACS1894152_1770 [Bacilli bacterium]|nr:hypothetical protein FACS1894152_1770 [Bacilli bacterium]
MNFTKIIDFFNNEKRAKTIARGAIGIFILSTVYAIMLTAGWSNGDNWFFTGSSNGKFMLNRVGLDCGRMALLAYLDYNILPFLPYAGTIMSYHFWNALAFSAFILLMFYIFKMGMGGILGTYLAATFAILIPLAYNPILFVHMDIIYPERAACLFLALFIVAYIKALETDKITHWIFALVFATILIYVKEPFIGMFTTLGAFTLYCKTLSKNAKWFSIALIVDVAIFLILWYFLSYMKSEIMYGDVFSSKIKHTIGRIFKLLYGQPLLIVIIALGFWRLREVIGKKDRSKFFYDVTLFGGLGYMSIPFYMGMFLSGVSTYHYFYIPVIIATAPSVAYWTNYALSSRKTFKYGRAILIIVILCARILPIGEIIEKNRADTIAAIQLIGFEKLGIPIQTYGATGFPHITNFIKQIMPDVLNDKINESDSHYNIKPLYIVGERDYEKFECSATRVRNIANFIML